MEAKWMSLGKRENLSPSLISSSDGRCDHLGRGAGHSEDPAPLRLPEPALAMTCHCGRPIVRGQPYRLEGRLEACCYSCASTVAGRGPSSSPTPATMAVVGR